MSELYPGSVNAVYSVYRLKFPFSALISEEFLLLQIFFHWRFRNVSPGLS